MLYDYIKSPPSFFSYGIRKNYTLNIHNVNMNKNQSKKITDNEIKSFPFFCKQNIQKRFYNRETIATLNNYEINFPTPFPFMQLK